MSKNTQPPTFGRMLALASPLIIFGVLATVFFIQLTSGKNASELPSALIGKLAPEFNLPPLSGLKENGIIVPGLKSADLKGQTSVVNIFASWCVPCRLEHPLLMKLSRDKTININIVGINYKDKSGNALRFLGGLGNPYSRVGVDPKGRIAIEWGFYGIPETLLIDRDGIVRYKIVGPINAVKYEKLKAEIAKLR